MKRRLKALGFAFLAAMALSAVVAAGAQAVEATFTRGDGAKKNTVITGHQEGAENFFGTTANSLKISCKIATYESTFKAPTSAITVTPHYAECVSGGLAMIVHLNGCHYVFHAGEFKAAEDTSHGSADIVCPTGAKITLTFGGVCEVHIPPQVGLKTVTYTNIKGVPGTETPHNWVTVDVNITNIKYTETDQPSPAFCALTEGFEGTDGTLVSNVKFKGYEDTENITVETPTGDGTFIKKTAYKHPVEDLALGIDVR